MKLGRRDFVSTLCALGATPAFGLGGCGDENGRFASVDGGADTQKPRNILFILTDDQRDDTLGVTGNSYIVTPHMDALANKGVLFKNNFVTTSICPTSRASIMTGRYARRHGVWNFNTALSANDLASSYPVLMRSAGYYTGYVGKWGIGGVAPAGSFDHFWGFMSGKYYPDEANPTGDHLDRRIADAAIDFLSTRNPDQPFCLTVGFKGAHAPPVWMPEVAALYAGVYFPRPATVSQAGYDALPPTLRDPALFARCFTGISVDPDDSTYGMRSWQEEVAGYYRLVSGVDRMVGEIISALATLGLAENTAIVLTSDNGRYLGERFMCGKWFAHEESIRTPMIVYDPAGGYEAGAVRTQMSLNIDVHPTLLELAGIAAPFATDGTSLLPLARSAEAPGRTDWFYEHLYDPEGRIPRSQGVRTHRFKYARYIDTDPLQEELYDLENDSGETQNEAANPDFAENLSELRALHDSWLTALSG